jgi:hypothetical protein
MVDWYQPGSGGEPSHEDGEPPAEHESRWAIPPARRLQALDVEARPLQSLSELAHLDRKVANAQVLAAHP